MKKEYAIPLRYLILLIIGILISATSVLYKILLTPTVAILEGLLNLSHSVFSDGRYIFFESTYVELIPACIAVSAYFLLIILNLSVEMSKEQRIYSLVISLPLFYILNTIRIYILSLLVINSSLYFDAVHKFSWYFVSIVLVVGLWFLVAHLFKIKQIPIYSDIKYLISKAKKPKKSRKKK